ncbi:unnamed protein product [Dicrocoelium dendriticum]|nr:unnamed protein product [Dicrocoelium dendriticum]
MGQSILLKIAPALYICFTYLFQNGSGTPTYLTANRPINIRFLFPHFTPFEDMNHALSRAQRMGLQYSEALTDRTAIRIWPEVAANITFIIHKYIEAALALRSEGNQSSSNFTMHELSIEAIKGSSETNENFFLYNLLRSTESMIADAKAKGLPPEFYQAFRDENLLDESSVAAEPLFMLGMRAWRMVFLLAVSANPSLFLTEKLVRPPLPDTFLTPSDTHDEWSLAFIDEYCRLIEEHYSEVITIPNGFCPSPCMMEPCANIPFTSSAKCIPTGTKWYQFNCSCQPNFKWIQSPNAIGHCQSDTTCGTYCDREGTRRCDVIEYKQFCVCRPTHMGPTCSKIRDPCLEMSSPSEVPGNTSCNAPNGGVCIGVPGTNTYRCVCPSAYISDPSYILPNCLAFKDRCMRVICAQGDCISSRDGQETYCICPDEAYGEHCELIRGKWAQWSPWSECTPSCGVSEYQRRVRTRDCLGEACRGGEGHLQMEMCITMPCPDETLALARQGRSEEVGELKVQMLQAQAARGVKLVGAVAQSLILISCVFAALAATAMAVSVHLM